ncbi:DUF4347 domain-containing protein [Acidovorax temperans]|uniref:DUF4347 domain-containing protein n=1 Tax=Acidovorax temperans TaxID=80878 RepID=UPI0030CCAFC1
MTDITQAEIAQAASPARSIVFIDSRVQDAATLLKGFPPDAEVVFLQAGQDGLAQMAAALGERGDVGAVHVLAHGSEGQLWLGNTFLDSNTLAGKTDALAALGRGLTEDGDLLVYACDLARGEVGAQFVARLAEMTGADVAASDDRTGAGGDWTLEVTSGQVSAASASATTYNHDLATITVTNGVDSGAGSLRQALADALAGDTITFQSNMTVTLSSGELAINKNLTIDGDLNNDGVADVTLDANHSSRVISVDAAGVLTLDGLIIKNGLSVGNGGDNTGNTIGPGRPGTGGLGGAIKNAGSLVILNSTITDNKASGGGGTGGAFAKGGGGGGGGGFGDGLGGIGGKDRVGEEPTAPSPGHGGNGSGTSGGQRGGFGGSDVGGAGGGATIPYVGIGYSIGGAGATASNGAISIGGGGGGSGGFFDGGAGGAAVGAIFNSGNLTIVNSAIVNNIAAGGGGGGGAASNYSSSGNGGAGGNGIGAVWNSSGTLRIDATTNTSLSTGNVGVGGSGGTVSGTGNIAGVAGSSTNGVLGTYQSDFRNAKITSATFDASNGLLSVTGTNLLAGDVINVGSLSVSGEGGSYTLTSANVTASSPTMFAVMLNAADQLAVRGILNKNGSVAVGGYF